MIPISQWYDDPENPKTQKAFFERLVELVAEIDPMGKVGVVGLHWLYSRAQPVVRAESPARGMRVWMRLNGGGFATTVESEMPVLAARLVGDPARRKSNCLSGAYFEGFDRWPRSPIHGPYELNQRHFSLHCDYSDDAMIEFIRGLLAA